MAEIKSSLELALEKAESYGRASKEEMAVAEYQEQGRHLAVEFLKGEGDLEGELKKLPAPAQPQARTAAKEVLLRNIGLPRDQVVDPRQDQAIAGLIQLAENRKVMARLKDSLEQVLQNYLQIRNNAIQQLKGRFAGGVNQMQRAMEAQYGTKMRLEPEQLPQFQEEMRRFQGQLQDQFEPMLEEIKQQMLRS